MQIEKKYDLSLTDCNLFLSKNNNLIFEDKEGKQFLLQDVKEVQQKQNNLF